MSTPANHTHTCTARPTRSANRWLVECKECDTIIYPGILSEKGAQVLAKELNGTCIETGCSEPAYETDIPGIGMYRYKHCEAHVLRNFSHLGIASPVLDGRTA
jgi:hypothetical protein